jgi:hypothetical protein
VLYPGVRTRIAVPAGVTAEGEALESMGQEPRTQAALFETLTDDPYQLTITGQGRLGPANAPPAAAGGGASPFRVAPAPIEKEMVWVLALTAGILAVGFYRLLSAKSPHPAAAGVATEPDGGPQPGAGKRKGSRRRS